MVAEMTTDLRQNLMFRINFRGDLRALVQYV